ncbi:hypothetical protein [Bradyrhizobium sp. ORS 375]|uniref:hypothetical protein n=1 Tax=Bradyrhizobium sp. (strain ORS 375) TaxID=566679 RepID=UPI0002FAED9C|nr:hypothetical protein [Bradyrhizobium sp. ORS 375]
MRLVRTILAFAIAVSLAILPNGTSTSAVTMSSGDMQPSMHMAVGSDMSMDECCPDDMKGPSSASHGYKCGMGYCCAGGTVALGCIRPVVLAPVAMAATAIAIPADQVASLPSGPPPFRPPRL